MPTKHVPRPHTNTLASRLKMPEQSSRLFRKRDPSPPAPSHGEVGPDPSAPSVEQSSGTLPGQEPPSKRKTSDCRGRRTAARGKRSAPERSPSSPGAAPPVGSRGGRHAGERRSRGKSKTLTTPTHHPTNPQNWWNMEHGTWKWKNTPSRKGPFSTPICGRRRYPLS